MAETTITTQHVASVTPGKGRGMKLISAYLQADTNETLTTGLSEISGVGFCPVEATDVDADSHTIAVQISGGTITFEVGKIGAYAGVTGLYTYVMVMGVSR